MRLLADFDCAVADVGTSVCLGEWWISTKQGPLRLCCAAGVPSMSSARPLGAVSSSDRLCVADYALPERELLEPGPSCVPSTQKLMGDTYRNSSESHECTVVLVR